MFLQKLSQIDRQIYTATLVVVALLLVGAYMYLVSLSVVNVVMSKETMQQITIAHSEITELETAYIEAQHVVSQELALQRGFVSTPNKVFLTAGDTNSVVVSRQAP